MNPDNSLLNFSVLSNTSWNISNIVKGRIHKKDEIYDEITSFTQYYKEKKMNFYALPLMC